MKRTSCFVIYCLIIFTSQYVSAESGWYLLIPPMSGYNEQTEYLQSFKILSNEPLSLWSQQGAYDSASECEAVKHNLLMADQNFYSKQSEDYINASEAKKKIMRFSTELANAKVNAWLSSRCIKSDDPRLSK